MNHNITIRPAIKSDIPAIFKLVFELAEYEKAAHEVWMNEEQYFIDFSEGLFEALVAEKNNQVIGTTIYYTSYSTWKGKMVHLEDFIVTKKQRRLGVGKLLFEAFITSAKQNSANLVRWNVLDWNEPAINFYKKYDSIIDKEWLHVKILFDKPF